MNDLAHLKKRLSAAFENPGPEGKPFDSGTASDPFSLYHDPEEARPQVHRDEAEPDHGSLSLWIAGGGLIICAAALSLGHREGNLMLAGGMLAIAGVFGIYHLFDRSRRRAAARVIAALREEQADREWVQHERTALISGIHESLGDLAIVRGLDGRIRMANSIYQEVTGAAAIIGQTCEEAGFTFEPSQRQGRSVARFETADGPRIFVWSDTIIRHPETGELLKESVAREITEETRSTAAADEARRKAEMASAAKSRLLATVAHEIRTPLTGLLGMADLLDKSRLGAEQRNYVAGLRQSGEVLSYLVEDLLDFATMEAGRFELRPVAESPRNLIEGIVEMLAPRAHFKGLEIASFVAPDVPEYLDLDPGRLRQVLYNIAGNAVKFTRRGGVLIAATIEDRELSIRVTDTGPGMTEAEKERIFEEFTQVGSLRARSAGKGLGLSISLRIIEAFGGSIQVESRKGSGSTFDIRFPVSLDMRHAGELPRASLCARSSVLVLAPEGPASRAIARTITALGGRCHVCHSGADIMQALASGEIGGRPQTDIIVDHRLEGDYLGACSDIATRLRLRRIFLVNPEQRQARIAGPYDAWLIRPIREQSLIDVLGGRLRGLEKRGATNDNRPVPGIARAASEKSRGRIFLAEDEPVNALLVRTTLEKAGYSVHHAGDYDMLKEMLDGNDGWRPDLVLTDLSMPGAPDGSLIADLCGRLKSAGHAHVGVVVLSGEQSESVRNTALMQGADSFLTKPVLPEKLVEAVDSALVTGRSLQSI